MTYAPDVPVLRCQWKIPMDTAIPADAVVNTWHFDCSDVTGPTHLAIKDALATAYGVAGSLFCGDINQNACVATFYDLSMPKPRAPIATYPNVAFSNVIAAISLPHELAVCLSFQGARVSGIPQARRRGRVYLGPCAQSAVTGSGTTAQITSTVQTKVRDMGASLLAASNAAANWKWVVWSEVAAPTQALVTNGWVDNDWDVQRRRGVVANVRQTF